MSLRRVKNAIESMYDGRVTITEYRDVMDDVTKQTRVVPFVAYEDIPCRLSRKNVVAADQSDVNATVRQETKLFVSPGVAIIPGSKCTVTQNGVTEDFRYAGYPARYSTHQEIVLELWTGRRA